MSWAVERPLVPGGRIQTSGRRFGHHGEFQGGPFYSKLPVKTQICLTFTGLTGLIQTIDIIDPGRSR
jgi:hypothetical protein